MRNSLPLVAALLALCCIGCGPPDGDALYTDLGCPRCHGFSLEGNRYGPSLKELDKHWESAGAIVTYMRDPKTVVGNDPRLKAQDGDFDLKMQPVTASQEKLEILAAWLLAPR